MSHLLFYNREKLKQHTRWRWGEEKFGEKVGVVNDWQELKESDSKYVIFGIPEDIGVRANYGRPGAAKAWNACLDALCNIQANTFTQAENVVILGEIDCKSAMMDIQSLEVDDPFYTTKIGSLIKEIDEKVTAVVQQIVTLNKIPIIIGGGHNNSYGNLKGTSLAFDQPINCVNLDAHSDFRSLEHRHSGNGFSYAFEDGYLNQYVILGLQRNYTSEGIFEKMNELKSSITYLLLESILEGQPTFEEALEVALKKVTGQPLGIELDLDVIAGMGSSAQSPTGLSLEQARQYIRFFAKRKHLAYIHLCEGAPVFELYENQVGKALATLISDVISK